MVRDVVTEGSLKVTLPFTAPCEIIRARMFGIKLLSRGGIKYLLS